MTPDEFFAQLLAAGFEDDVLGIVQRMSTKLNNLPRTPSEILDGLEHIGLSKAVTHLRDHIRPTELDQETQAYGPTEHTKAPRRRSVATRGGRDHGVLRRCSSVKRPLGRRSIEGW